MSVVAAGEGEGEELALAVTKTLIFVILDESGSMQDQKNDVIGGYNSFIETQMDISINDEVRLGLVKFNHEVMMVHSAVALVNVPKLNKFNYVPSGSTALYDAVAEGIKIAEKDVKVGERVFVLIMTDGEDNASKKVTVERARDLIKSHEALGNWTFVYIGQNPDKWAEKTGQAHSNTSPYNMIDQERNFRLASTVTASFRSQQSPQLTEGIFLLQLAER